MKRLVLFGLLAVVSLVGVVSLSMPTAYAATFDQSRIIDDILFDNSATMDAGQINTFLNGFPNSCISPNSGFSAVLPTGYSPTGGYTYGTFKSAGEVIATASQVYGINPQVLLTTLQKEQSLVAGGAGYCNNGDDHKYAAAVGYGCPDSGTRYNYTNVSLYMRNGVVHSTVGPTCVNSASKAGFSQQVIRAAWLLKFGEQRSKGNIGWAVIKGSWDNSDDPESCYGGPVTAGNRQVCPSGPTTYYDGYKTIDGVAVRMGGGATAALYWYTPHFSGNQNFFNIFTGWFGLPYGNDTDTAHPNGTVVTDGYTAFLLENGTRRAITTPSVFISNRLAWEKVKPASSGDLNLPLGTPLSTLAAGSVFTTGDGNVYVTDYFGGVLKKQLITARSFAELRFRWNDVLTTAPSTIPAATQPGYYIDSRHPANTLVSANGSVYITDETSKRYLGAVTFVSNLYHWDDIVQASAGDAALLNGADATIRQGTMLLSGGSIYLIDYDGTGAYKRPVGPYECYINKLHYYPSDWIVTSPTVLPARTGSLFTC